MQTQSISHTFGEIIGFFFSYSLFTLILYFILSFLHKIPSSWGILEVGIVSASIVLVGFILRKVLL